METDEVRRGPGRPRKDIEDVRPEAHADPREAARIRTKQILGTMAGIDDHQDEYWIDPNYTPAGWSREWKRYTVLNEIQQTHLNSLMRTGWEYVTPDGYPVMPPTNGMVIHRGNVLMQRPEAITKMMAERDQRLAQMQVDIKAAQVDGIDPNFAKSNKGDPIRAHGIAGAKKSYSPMQVPD